MPIPRGMSTQGTIEGQAGTLTGRAPAARIFALVVLSLVVLLGSLLAVRAIGQHEAVTPISAAPGETTADDGGVLVVPKDEPKPKPAPKPERKPRTTRQASAAASTPVQSSAASTASASAPAPSPTPAPAPTPRPAPVQSAPAPAPAPTPKPTARAAKKPAPVQHTVVVTQ